ncbi:hypothetical protein A0J61_02180 [Choanephora cucurbitarum]|uniref:Uncharacterized protein n=1 Tax=Choanephora cucurbitarum TaxID=101091 RepID=A0A1C7NMP7_9FUNG|nr:hypothetical protein A0J61_02180 [Choanephora cucurbitarum]
MKFSIAAASALAITFLSSVAKAESYDEIMKDFCGGLTVTGPTASDVIVAGQNATVSVTRVANSHEKQITGLDLYAVDTNDQPRYVQNVWAGSYSLGTSASISDGIPSNSTAGTYYYRVWVTNIINGGHGPDCTIFSPRFKVTTGSHTNDAGLTTYEQSLDDDKVYSSEHAKGCFGLNIQSPSEGSTLTHGEHTNVLLSRDSASPAEVLESVNLYKASSTGEDELVQQIWSGKAYLPNAYSYKDHLQIPKDKLDSSATYYYQVQIASQDGETCSFRSGNFNVASE